MRGRNTRSSTMVDGRQYATGVAGMVITFECSRGHTYKINYGNKPPARRPSAAGCKLLAQWWRREAGGCIGECPKCKRTAT